MSNPVVSNFFPNFNTVFFSCSIFEFNFWISLCLRSALSTLNFLITNNPISINKWLEQKVTYAGIKQRWLIVESAERKQSNIQKLNSKIEQEKKTALKSRKKLETTGFDIVTQPQDNLKSVYKKLKLWDEQIFINQVKKN